MSDATATASPRPWKAIREIGPDEELYSVFIVDANIKPVARIWPENAADAALIVAAVNERERLRDVVRRLATFAEDYRHYVRTVMRTNKAPLPHERFGADIDALLREARAAIGEEANRA